MHGRLACGTVLGGVGATMLLLGNPLARSIGIRLLSRARPDPARARGIRVTTGPTVGAWTRLPLVGGLSRPLSAVAGRPLAAVAYGHFGGFGGRRYAAFMDPESPYYQAWTGAYVVVAPDGPPFGFDRAGRPDPQAALQLLEADQRLVLRTAGLFPLEDPRPRVRLLGSAEPEPVIAWAANWWRYRGEAETFSAFARGGGRAGRRGRWLYGTVPQDHPAPVDDYHPLTMHGSIWLRFDTKLGATVAKFYVYAAYTDRNGNPWCLGEAIAGECEAAMDRIRFDHVHSHGPKERD